MNQVIEKLLAVQELDRRILRLEEKRKAGPEALAEEEGELGAHRKKLDEATHRAKEAMRTAERKNAELDAVDKKMKDLNLKLNTARSNKEYEALKHEIAGFKADYEILEEEALQQWEVSEAREEEAEREKEKIRGLEEDLAAKRREWEEAEKEIDGQLDALKEQRARGASEVPATWMQIYDRVLDLRGAPAVVEVSEQYCQGCQMSITVHDVTRAITGREIVQCKACSRILYAETL